MSEEKDKDNCQIFIARLHPKIAERDLKYKFEKYGSIKDIRLKSGYCFIDYETPEAAEAAINKMDGKEMEGQKIVVQVSKKIYKDKGRRNNRERDRSGSPPRRRGPKTDDSCFNCGKTGHWANECREPLKKRREFREKGDITCFKCGERGHKQMSCPEKRRRGSRSISRDRPRRRRSTPSSRSSSRSVSRDRLKKRKFYRSRSRSRSVSSRSRSYSSHSK